MALQCDIQLPISAVKDFRFLIQKTIAEARKVRIQAANYGFIVPCCNKTRSLDVNNVDFINEDFYCLDLLG